MAKQFVNGGTDKVPLDLGVPDLYQFFYVLDGHRIDSMEKAWGYLIAKGYTDTEAETFLRNLRRGISNGE